MVYLLRRIGTGRQDIEPRVVGVQGTGRSLQVRPGNIDRHVRSRPDMFEHLADFLARTATVFDQTDSATNNGCYFR